MFRRLGKKSEPLFEYVSTSVISTIQICYFYFDIPALQNAKQNKKAEAKQRRVLATKTINLTRLKTPMKKLTSSHSN